jgi:hypothetical protein
MTIYRKLSDNMKRKYDDSTTNMLPTNSDVSDDTFKQESQQQQQQPIDVNDKISTINDDVEILDDALPLNFVKEYISQKDNSKIQEYECQFVYKDLIIPLSVTLNVTKEKIISMMLNNDKFKLLNKTFLNNTNKK